MENAINTLRIQNFKSIKDVTINPRRVNLIIGMPNVGKSNILEAMSLLGGMFFDKEDDKFMEGQIRYENIRNMFYDNNWNDDLRVQSNIGFATVSNPKEYDGVYVCFANDSISKENEIMEKIINYRENIEEFAGEDSLEERKFMHKYKDQIVSYDYYFSNGKKNGDEVSIEESIPLVRKYKFEKDIAYGKSYKNNFLKPPLGSNMVDVLQHNGIGLRKEIGAMFKPYGLNFAMRVADGVFEVQKNEDGFITTIPYSLIADTLQRIIFYLAAIESNDDSVLLFEEPEAHTFPVYTSMLGRKIAESKNNQFFIATHSPYLVTEIMEQLLPEEGQEAELAIFLAYYEDYQTKVKQLSDEEVREIRNDSIDVFYNLSRFTPGSNSYA
ncbi:AAA family ATPase [Hymenobacter psychrophilus]|uniref:AAA domain-containing protein, putative AbiEii toxin, Type IV TA system n=1 Tax=Hymenobacter psychrophilus TaxID=651662 RepID=A0A1H3KLJ4_9BACT|nr:AAA family ATPase [Hymenobacter psychrophilus]SDY52615.1 AAA domain-containing protein, putative AbiEii toxin, Type IV TA system [Hymenobacter psychrophilus]